jgi:tetratricopeptide (TPR) repeat protein
MLAVLKAMAGAFTEARELVAQGARVMEQFGLRLWLAVSLMPAIVETLANDMGTAEQILRKGFRELDAMGEKGFLSTLAAELAHVLCAQDAYEEAERFTSVSRESAAADDNASQVGWRSAYAKVLAFRGSHDDAEQHARKAVLLAEETDGLYWQANALADLGEVLTHRGKTEAAAEALQEAVRLHEEKGNIVSATKTRRFLEELKSTPRIPER